MQAARLNLVEDDVSTALQDEVFVVQHVNQSTRRCYHNLRHSIQTEMYKRRAYSQTETYKWRAYIQTDRHVQMKGRQTDRHSTDFYSKAGLPSNATHATQWTQAT